MVLYGTDLSRLAEDVDKGIVDYGFLPSGWLELNRPDLLPLLRVQGPAREAAVYEAEPYPFLTTTRLVPTYGLAAGPLVPWRLREQVRGERGGAGGGHNRWLREGAVGALLGRHREGVPVMDGISIHVIVSIVMDLMRD